MVAPILSSTLTDELTQRFATRTRLVQVPEGGDFSFEGEVVEEMPREMTKVDMQREQIIRALRRNGGSRRAAAAELFISERTLYRRIKELNIEE